MSVNLTYHEYSGMHFREGTPEKVKQVLIKARAGKTRIRIDLGDAETGKSWSEEHGVEGYVGRSTGEIKVPLLIANARSIGGGEIMAHCIVCIWTSGSGEILYQHPTYHPKYAWGHAQIIESEKEAARIKVMAPPYPAYINTPKEYVAGFATTAQARRWLNRKLKYEIAVTV